MKNYHFVLVMTVISACSSTNYPADFYERDGFKVMPEETSLILVNRQAYAVRLKILRSKTFIGTPINLGHSSLPDGIIMEFHPNPVVEDNAMAYLSVSDSVESQVKFILINAKFNGAGWPTKSAALKIAINRNEQTKPLTTDQ